jgi:predicted porin
VKADYYVFMLGGVLSFEIAPNTRLNVGGGYYRSLTDSRYSSATTSSSQSYETENSFVSLGAAYQLNYSTSLRLKWSILNTKQYSIGETDKYQGLGLGIKYDF